MQQQQARLGYNIVEDGPPPAPVYEPGETPIGDELCEDPEMFTVLELARLVHRQLGRKLTRREYHIIETMVAQHFLVKEHGDQCDQSHSQSSTT